MFATFFQFIFKLRMRKVRTFIFLNNYFFFESVKLGKTKRLPSIFKLLDSTDYVVFNCAVMSAETKVPNCKKIN